MTVLVLTVDPLPLPGLAATGAGLRAWSLAEGLKSAGLDARAVMPAPLLAGRADPESEPYRSHVYPAFDAAEFVEQSGADVVVAQHWGMLSRLSRCGCPLAIDLAGPHLLERRLWGHEDLSADLAEKIEALSRADYVVCSGRDQRLYFLAWLTMAGFDPADPDLCPAIPFSWSPEGPPPRGNPPGQSDEVLFLSGGVLLPWQDPRPSVESLLAEMDAAGRGRLLFCAGSHPDMNVAGGEHLALLKRLDEHPRAETSALVSFDDWIDRIGRADVAFDLMPRNNEREIAFPTRTAIYLWGGLPTLHANHDELGRMIRDAGAGWALDPGDSGALRCVVREILDAPGDLSQRGDAARRLASDKMNWARTIEPLARFCRNPTIRAKTSTVLSSGGTDSTRILALERQLARAHVETEAVRGKWPMRWAGRLKRLAWLAIPFVYVAAFLATAAVCAATFVSDLANGRQRKPNPPEPTA